jgi:predicted acylesterase/phospholipase RssA
MILKSLIVTLLAVSTSAKVNDKSNSTKSCKALAMSGGGSKGSYEAGVLYGLVTNDPDKTNYAYDVVTGVSAGSINTVAVSLFAPGDETNMV